MSGGAIDLKKFRKKRADYKAEKDGQDRLDNLEELVNAADSFLREADLAVASFPALVSPAGFGLVKRLAAWGIRRFGDPGGSWAPTAPLSGQRALPREALEAARPFSGGYGVEVTTTIRVLRAGLRVVEVPTTMAHAATGRDMAGFVHRGRQFSQVAAALLRAWWPRR